MSEKLDKKRLTRRQFLETSGTLSAVALAGSAFPGQFGNEEAAAAFGDEQQEAGTVTKPGICHSCLYGKCTLRYTVKDNTIVKVEGDPDGPWNRGRACVRGLSVANFIHNPYRITRPLKRTNPEKGLNVDPGWVEISYEEAVDILTEKLKAVKESDPRKLMWMNGFPSFLNFLTGAGSIFAIVFGTPNMIDTTGSLCSVHLSTSLVNGGFVQYPDFEHTKYVIAVGATLGASHAPADGTDFVMDAVENGLKAVIVDPHCSPDVRIGEWVPIRPGSELPYMLALAHTILHEIGKVDEWFLKNRTTGVYLIATDGSDYERDPETHKPLIWDPVDEKAKTFDDASIKDYALEGTYTVNGSQVKTGFEWVKQGTAEYTPEWAEPLTTIPAATIRQHANDLVTNAQIGSTIDINGFTFPLRPACVYIGRGLTSHRDGHLAYWVAMVINQLIGAVAVPGGDIVVADPKALTPSEDGTVIPESFHSHFNEWTFPPKTLSAMEYIPYSFSTGYRVVDTILEPEKYGVDVQPEVFINYAGNIFTKGGDPERISEALRKIPFIASIALHMDEHTMFADLVIPDTHYLEQPSNYNFDIYRPGRNQLKVLMVNDTIVEPPDGVRVVDEVFMDIAERLGMLYGPGNINFVVNNRYGIKPELELPLDKRVTVKQMLDAFLRSNFGPEATFDKVAARGFVKAEIPPEQAYNYFYFPDNQTRHPLYNVYFERAGKQLLDGMHEAGIEPPGLSEEDIKFYYRGFPAWKETPNQAAPAEFDLYGVLWKAPQFLFDINGTNANPWLIEVAKTNPQYGKIVINIATAAEKGLKDGDLVYVESQTGKIGPYPVFLTEMIHPECAGVMCGLGGKDMPGMDPVRKSGIPYNRLIPTDWQHVDVITGGLEISPRLKLTRA